MLFSRTMRSAVLLNQRQTHVVISDLRQHSLGR